uniref:Uncharacterized protein n=1 Tax=Fibrocapsa japonica TaxID=94617 RepID=A0A7S2V9N4_9STRA|mmetsp:Transcript_9696/g.14905  ORF Transcript_9696/g.14905 Transcript_9696/m.14905 type:complete len:103 (+) Transcript_9696:77-385(+)
MMVETAPQKKRAKTNANHPLATTVSAPQALRSMVGRQKQMKEDLMARQKKENEALKAKHMKELNDLHELFKEEKKALAGTDQTCFSCGVGVEKEPPFTSGIT